MSISNQINNRNSASSVLNLAPVNSTNTDSDTKMSQKVSPASYRNSLAKTVKKTVEKNEVPSQEKLFQEKIEQKKVEETAQTSVQPIEPAGNDSIISPIETPVAPVIPTEKLQVELLSLDEKADGKVDEKVDPDDAILVQNTHVQTIEQREKSSTPIEPPASLAQAIKPPALPVDFKNEETKNKIPNEGVLENQTQIPSESLAAALQRPYEQKSSTQITSNEPPEQPLPSAISKLISSEEQEVIVPTAEEIVPVLSQQEQTQQQTTQQQEVLQSQQIVTEEKGEEEIVPNEAVFKVEAKTEIKKKTSGKITFDEGVENSESRNQKQEPPLEAIAKEAVANNTENQVVPVPVEANSTGVNQQTKEPLEASLQVKQATPHQAPSEVQSAQPVAQANSQTAGTNSNALSEATVPSLRENIIEKVVRVDSAKTTNITAASQVDASQQATSFESLFAKNEKPIAVKIVEQVTHAFSQTSGTETFKVRLQPPELGNLQIELTKANGIVTARIETDTPAAQKILLESLSQLKETLVQQGHQVDKIDVEWNQRGFDEESSDRPSGQTTSEQENTERDHANAEHLESTNTSVEKNEIEQDELENELEQTNAPTHSRRHSMSELDIQL